MVNVTQYSCMSRCIAVVVKYIKLISTMSTKRRAAPVSRVEKKQKTSDDDDEEEKEQEIRMRADSQRRERLLAFYTKSQEPPPELADERQKTRAKLNDLITRDFVKHDPCHARFLVCLINTYQNDIQEEDIQYEKKIYNDEADEDRLKRASNRDEWETMGEQEGGVTLEDTQKCISDDCWYEGNMDRMDGLVLYRLKGTSIYMCDVCLDNEYNEELHIEDIRNQ